MVNPNPFTPSEKDKMRTYMMVPKAFSTPQAGIESIFLTIDGMYDDVTDQGATQAAIRADLAELLNIETLITNYKYLTLATEVTGAVRINAIRSLAWLRKVEGPAVINRLSSRLAFPPCGKYFDQAETQDTGPSGAVTYRVPRTAM